MRVGIIGLGRAGNMHLDAWRLVPGVEVVAVSDAAVSGRSAARAAGLRAHRSLAQMLDREKLDAISICTPPADHADQAIACLERGLHVLCEKPLALTPWDALAMLQTSGRCRRQLLLATKFRHVPELVQTRQIIASGELGEPVTFEVSFCSPVDMSGRWNSQRHRAGGGVIMDNGCHAFDIVSFLFGSITRIQATVLKQLQPLSVEDSATIQIRAGDGVIGRVDLSWSLATGRDRYVVVHCSRGTVEVGWKGSRVRRNGEEWRDIGNPYDKTQAHRQMNACFHDLVTGNGEAWISPMECLRTVAAVDAAYRSIYSGSWEWVEIEQARERATGT